MVTLDGRFLDGAVHPFDLAVGPRVARFGQPMFDVEIGAGRFEDVASERQLLRAHFLDVFRRPAIASWIGEVRAVVGEYRVDAVRHDRSEVTQEVASDPTGSFLVVTASVVAARDARGFFH